jgi:rhodanese-related sulfurtransferase
MQTIDAHQVKEQIDNVPVYDVRGDDEYRAEHIPGAKTAPLGSLETRVNDILNKDETVVVYCGSPECDLSKKAADRLETLGFSDVRRFVGGVQGWKDAGFETTSS